MKSSIGSAMEGGESDIINIRSSLGATPYVSLYLAAIGDRRFTKVRRQNRRIQVKPGVLRVSYQA